MEVKKTHFREIMTNGLLVTKKVLIDRYCCLRTVLTRKRKHYFISYSEIFALKDHSNSTTNLLSKKPLLQKGNCRVFKTTKVTLSHSYLTATL